LYHGYFTFLIFGVIGVLFFTFAAERNWFSRFRASFATHGEFLVLALGTTLLVLFLLYYPYARFSAEAGTRPADELKMLSPNFGAWFSASPFSVFYSRQHFYKPDANTGENTLFAGWIIYLLVVAAVTIGFAKKRDADLRLAAVLAASSLLIMLAMTSWGGGEANFYLWITQGIPGLRAFRSFARIAYLLIALDTVAAALLLDHFYRAQSARLGRIAVVTIACLAALESLDVGQYYYSPRLARLRADALVRQWRAARFHKVLLFAPGLTNQPLEPLHLDCWHAALLVGKATVNGYSGNIPPGYLEFLAEPTVAHAEELRARLRLPASEVSLVTDWAEQDKRALGWAKVNSP
ncbi:MAG: hypothetical protein M3Y86_00105, partial [Verrucomicrobiota bacterium]|nr:hypothetical protein [Verrucomicrobiota bacterium]